MKKILKVLGWLLVLVVLLVALVVFGFGGPLITLAVNHIGPHVLGVPVTLQGASFAPLKGDLTLTGLHVGNPAGYKTAGLFELSLLQVDLDMASLFKKVMVIREIRIEAPEITYERSLQNSNIGQLLDQLSSKESAAAPKKKEGGKKVVIRKVTISGARVHASITALGGNAMLLPLPPISLANIGGTGEEAKGVTGLEALRNIIGAVFTAVTDVVTGAGKLAVDGVKAVGGVATDSVKAIGTGAGKAFDGMKNLMGLGGKDQPPAKPAK